VLLFGAGAGVARLCQSILLVAFGASLFVAVPWSQILASKRRLGTTGTTMVGDLPGVLVDPPHAHPLALAAGLILWFIACAAILSDFVTRAEQRDAQRRSGGA
jgi:hypothetical protein